MSLEEEDDFWNSSDVKAFNFDDEDQTGAAQPTQSTNQNAPSAGIKTLGSILAAKPSSNEPFLRPSMIMCNGDKIDKLIEFLDNVVPTPQAPSSRLDPKTYITQIVDKKKTIDFSPYKSKREKLLLLDCAICCSDGNTITAVTIFMSKSLKKSIFFEELRKRPIAVDHYYNYLEASGRPLPSS